MHEAKDQSFRYRKDLGLPNQVCLFRHSHHTVVPMESQLSALRKRERNGSTRINCRKRPLLRCREKPQVFEARGAVRIDERSDRSDRHKRVNSRSAIGYETPHRRAHRHAAFVAGPM